MKRQRVVSTAQCIVAAMCLMLLLWGNPLTLADEGGRIAFSKLMDDNWQIVVTNEDGKNMRNLSKNNANDHYPSWSFDGKYIAFASDGDAAFPREAYNLYIMDADGSNQRRVTKKNNKVRECYPSFSPDGKKLVFTREIGFNEMPRKWTFKIYTIDADGRNERYLTDGYGAKWSPDGRSIVFLPLGDNHVDCNITIMDTDGKNQVEIARGCDPSWSRDGKHIAFISHREIYRMDSDGENIVCLTNGGPLWSPLGLSWSPDGKHIAFWSNTGMGKIYKVSADGGTAIAISEDGCIDPSWCDPAFAVSPAGKLRATWGWLKQTSK